MYIHFSFFYVFIYIHVCVQCVHLLAPCCITKQLPSPPPRASTATKQQTSKPRSCRTPTHPALNRLHTSMFGGLPTSIHTGKGILRQQNHGTVLPHSFIAPDLGFGSEWLCPKSTDRSVMYNTYRCFMGIFSSLAHALLKSYRADPRRLKASEQRIAPGSLTQNPLLWCTLVPMVSWFSFGLRITSSILITRRMSQENRASTSVSYLCKKCIPRGGLAKFLGYQDF